MKSFEEICKMTQPEVKKYMKGYLTNKKYNVVDEDGFLYAKGDVPVLLVAHMDTVHKEQCKKIVEQDGKMSSPQGIGGDDRCGVFIIMNLVKRLHCSVLLCEDEEKGCQGAHKFTDATYKRTDDKGNIIVEKYINNLGVNYMIEFDRRGNKDAVFYSCDNKDFIDFVEDATNFKFAYGSCSDISVLMPASKLSAVNLSCGYYKAHTTDEYVVYNEMIDTLDAAEALIKEKCDKPFEYVEKKRACVSYGNYGRYGGSYGGSFGGGYDYYDGYGYGYGRSVFNDSETDKREDLAMMAKADVELELEVIVCPYGIKEKCIIASGATKAECWMNLFIDNPNIRFNDIVDYTWG